MQPVDVVLSLPAQIADIGDARRCLRGDGRARVSPDRAGRQQAVELEVWTVIGPAGSADAGAARCGGDRHGEMRAGWTSATWG
jgi:hypothetical protein